MDKKTRLKVTVITTISIIFALIYTNRNQLINDLKAQQRENEWSKEKPQGQLIDGRKNGEWRTFFTNGRLARIESYKNDTLHGEQIIYTPSGRYNSRSNYNMGITVDSFFLYHSNGKINLEEFKNGNGENNGIFKVYYSNGQLRQIGQYKKDKFEGEFRSYYESGKLAEIKFYQENKNVGTWIYLSEMGDTTKVEKY